MDPINQEQDPNMANGRGAERPRGNGRGNGQNVRPPVHGEAQDPQIEMLNASLRMMTTMTENFALNNAIMRIPIFDGKTPDLKNFLQDLRNAQTYVEPHQQANLVTAVLGRLHGAARDCCYGRRFNNLGELILHLKKRFAPGKDYDYYVNKLGNVRMNQGETVSDFYDRLRILMSAAESSLKEEMTPEQRQNQLPLMMQPLHRRCRDIFIKGLTPAIATAVDIAQPQDLEAAYKLAVRTESRMEARIIPDTRPKFHGSSDQRPYTNQYRQNNSPYVGMIDQYGQQRQQGQYPGPCGHYWPNRSAQPYYPAPYAPPAWNYGAPYYPVPNLNTYGAQSNPGTGPIQTQGTKYSIFKNETIPDTTKNGSTQTQSTTENTHTMTTPNGPTNQAQNGRRPPFRPIFRPPLFNPYPNLSNPNPRWYRPPVPQAMQYHRPAGQYPTPYQNQTPNNANFQDNSWKQRPDNRNPEQNRPENQNPVLKINQMTAAREEQIQMPSNPAEWETSPQPLEYLLPEQNLEYQEWEPMLQEMTTW